MNMPAGESALVVLVPEAEALVSCFRDRHDPGAAFGMPAHITILYPFVPAQNMRESHREDLRTCCARFAPFQFSLAQTARFPGVLYLAPKPDQPFRELTTAIWERFPDFPPYGGRFHDLTPHLTLAQVEDEQTLDAVTQEFAEALHGKLPIHATASQIALMDDRSGRWQVVATLRLGTAHDRRGESA